MDLPDELWTLIGEASLPLDRLALATTCKDLSFLRVLPKRYLDQFIFRTRVKGPDGNWTSSLILSESKKLLHGVQTRRENWCPSSKNIDVYIYYLGCKLVNCRWDDEFCFITDISESSSVRRRARCLLYEMLLQKKVLVDFWPLEQDVCRFDYCLYNINYRCGTYVITMLKGSHIREAERIEFVCLDYRINLHAYLKYCGDRVSQLRLPYDEKLTFKTQYGETRTIRELQITSIDNFHFIKDRLSYILTIDNELFDGEEGTGGIITIYPPYLEIEVLWDDDLWYDDPMANYVFRCTEDFEVVIDTSILPELPHSEQENTAS